MNILVINGDCIQTNTSANLCHLAYIRGLLDAGHEVTLLSADGRDYALDTSMVIPAEVKQYTYYGVSLYEKLSLHKRTIASYSTANSSTSKESTAAGSLQLLMTKAKAFVRSLYGIHGIYAKFVRKAQKFRSDIEYDYVLSISTPVTSHLLAHNLLKAGHIKCNHWIQIWEDPWYLDAYGFMVRDNLPLEELRVLSFGENGCYVSPLTLENQKRLYPEAAQKMFWQPLPFYYKSEARNGPSVVRKHYGYFGDYVPAARDLAPFYEAAKENNIEVTICGNPDNLFKSTEHIHIHPRLSLQKLKPIEDSTNVLVFLCNRRGGQIPGKIYQYSATNKIILFILDGTEEEQKVLYEFFGKFNRYIFCQNTIQDIGRAIRQIESGDLDNIQNHPLEIFKPATIVLEILNGCQ